MVTVQQAALVTIGTASLYLLQPLATLLPTPLHGHDTAVLAQLPSSSKRNPKVPGSVPSGPRGGCSVAQIPTQTLLFQNRVGQTVSAQPVFLWHLSGDSIVDLEFVLTDVAQEEPIFTKKFSQPKAGFMELKLPATVQLVAGQQYLWSVRLLCSTKSKDKNPTAQGKIEYIVTSPELTRQLKTATSPAQRAELYAEQGLWYDALGTLWTAYRAKPGDAAAHQAFFSLLERMGHQDVVEQEQNRQLSRMVPGQ